MACGFMIVVPGKDAKSKIESGIFRAQRFVGDVPAGAIFQRTEPDFLALVRRPDAIVEQVDALSVGPCFVVVHAAGIADACGDLEFGVAVHLHRQGVSLVDLRTLCVAALCLPRHGSRLAFIRPLILKDLAETVEHDMAGIKQFIGEQGYSLAAQLLCDLQLALEPVGVFDIDAGEHMPPVVVEPMVGQQPAEAKVVWGVDHRKDGVDEISRQPFMAVLQINAIALVIIAQD
ncbi:MAG: hypothetical protein BWY83_00241 [bacterium ADurb.Bin478]|nr:MAG: hypothetical protein BWY83_00241 [bacterium ADurb.Bin478]